MNAMPSEIGQIVWRHRNVIDVDCFTKEELYFLLDQARHMENVMDRPIKKVPVLRGKMAVNLLRELTGRGSFELAEKCSADVSTGPYRVRAMRVDDEGYGLTSAMGAIRVMRHGAVGAAQYLASKLKRTG